MTKRTISTIGAWRRRKDIFTKHESVTHLISHEAVYRTAPAKTGLLNTESLQLFCVCVFFNPLLCSPTKLQLYSDMQLFFFLHKSLLGEKSCLLKCLSL